MIDVEKGLRGLHDADLRLGEKAQRAPQKVSVGNKIRVEHRDERGIGQRQCIVVIAGLFAGVVGASDVAGADPLAELS